MRVWVVLKTLSKELSPQVELLEGHWTSNWVQMHIDLAVNTPMGENL